MKEKILEAFARLGFCLEKSDDVGYEFEYEGMTLLYLCNEDDEDFLAIALPGFYEYDEENVATYCALSEKINASLKYVKAFTRSIACGSATSASSSAARVWRP